MRWLGGMFGWIVVWLLMATLLNYLLKFINKKFSKEINQNASVKKAMNLLMKIFVRHHRLWGVSTVFLLSVHVYLQVTSRGPSLTGALTGLLLWLQVFLGLYGAYGRKKRQGFWFMMHRSLALIILLGLFVHINLRG